MTTATPWHLTILADTALERARVARVAVVAGLPIGGVHVAATLPPTLPRSGGEPLVLMASDDPAVWTAAAHHPDLANASIICAQWQPTTCPASRMARVLAPITPEVLCAVVAQWTQREASADAANAAAHAVRSVATVLAHTGFLLVESVQAIPPWRGKAFIGTLGVEQGSVANVRMILPPSVVDEVARNMLGATPDPAQIPHAATDACTQLLRATASAVAGDAPNWRFGALHITPADPDTVDAQLAEHANPHYLLTDDGRPIIYWMG